jgi:predicted phosphoadenosine phosphosulfate sulfurtransferase
MDSRNYLNCTVYEAALDRIRLVYDWCDDVCVSVSGGKDSTVLFELALIVAKERGRLPLKVFWLDQEAEWQATVDHVRDIMYRQEVQPYWFQIPFRLTNSLSHTEAYLDCWNPNKKDLWLHEQDEIAIKDNPTKYDRFKDLVKRLPAEVVSNEHTELLGVLVGVRMSESQSRTLQLGYTKKIFKGITWTTNRVGKARVFWPLYDWQNQDIWAALAKNKWNYNRIYDLFYRHGISDQRMRVSALIHETAWHDIKRLQELEPNTYDRYLHRVAGTNCFAHLAGDVMPRKLPPMFRDWKEYRDYLLRMLVLPENQPIFESRWRNKHSEEWHKVQIREVLVNDVDGTISNNARVKFRQVQNRARRQERDRIALERYIHEGHLRDNRQD